MCPILLTPLELFNRPANEFVAGFLGAPKMNFFDETPDRICNSGFVYNETKNNAEVVVVPKKNMPHRHNIKQKP